MHTSALQMPIFEVQDNNHEVQVFSRIESKELRSADLVSIGNCNEGLLH